MDRGCLSVMVAREKCDEKWARRIPGKEIASTCPVGLTVYCMTVHNESAFSYDRHKGLRQFHEQGNAKGVPSAMADKLRKLLFAWKRPTRWTNLASFRVGGCTLSRATLKDFGA